jgi:hypothetical protein
MHTETAETSNFNSATLDQTVGNCVQDGLHGQVSIIVFELRETAGQPGNQFGTGHMAGNSSTDREASDMYGNISTTSPKAIEKKLC